MSARESRASSILQRLSCAYVGGALAYALLGFAISFIPPSDTAWAEGLVIEIYAGALVFVLGAIAGAVWLPARGTAQRPREPYGFKAWILGALAGVVAMLLYTSIAGRAAKTLVMLFQYMNARQATAGVFGMVGAIPFVVWYFWRLTMRRFAGSRTAPI